MKLVADTHGIVWLLENSPELGDAAKAALCDSRNEIVIPVIVLAELQFTNRTGRHGISLDQAEEWIAGVDNARVLPVTLRMVKRAPPGLRIHDGIIVSTALEIAAVEGVPCPVVTCDSRIVASGLVTVIW